MSQKPRDPLVESAIAAERHINDLRGQILQLAVKMLQAMHHPPEAVAALVIHPGVTLLYDGPSVERHLAAARLGPEASQRIVSAGEGPYG